jgi:hypothetical protein
MTTWVESHHSGKVAGCTLTARPRVSECTIAAGNAARQLLPVVARPTLTATLSNSMLMLRCWDVGEASECVHARCTVDVCADRSLLGSGLSSGQLGAPRLLGCPCPDVGSILGVVDHEIAQFSRNQKYNRRSATMGNRHPTLRKCGDQLTAATFRERRLALQQLLYRKERFAERNATVTNWASKTC